MKTLKNHALRRVKDPYCLDDRDRFTLANKKKDRGFGTRITFIVYVDENMF